MVARLTSPYYMNRGNRVVTEMQLRIEAANERKNLLETKNWQNRVNWRERFERNPLQEIDHG